MLLGRWIWLSYSQKLNNDFLPRICSFNWSGETYCHKVKYSYIDILVVIQEVIIWTLNLLESTLNYYFFHLLENARALEHLTPFISFVSTYFLKLQHLLSLFKVGVGELWPMDKILPTTCFLFVFLMTCELRLVFTFVNGWKKIKAIAFQIRENYIKFKIYVHKVLLKSSHTHSLHVFYGCFPTQQQS